MPTVVFPDGGHDGGGLARFNDGHDLIGLGTSEVAIHEVIAPAWGIFLNGYTPFLGAVLDPVVVLRSDVVQHLPTDWIDLAIGPEKADGPPFLLKGLDRGMEQDPIEATIIETDVILMVFVEGVHGVLQRVRSLEHTPVNASVFYACPQSCGADFSGPCGVAQSARIGGGGLLVHGSLPQAGNLRLDATDATSGSLRPGQHCGRISSAWESCATSLYEFGRGFPVREWSLVDPGGMPR